MPRLYWFKDGQPLTASAHIRMVNKKALHSLEILSVTREDAGQYSAYVSNTVGAAYSSAQLLVQGGCWGLMSAGVTPMAGLGLGPRSSPQVQRCGGRADTCLPAFQKVLGVGVGGFLRALTLGAGPGPMQDTLSYFRSDLPASFRP